MRCRGLLMVAALVLAGAGSVRAQDESGLELFVLGGSQTKPTGFDVGRTVDYGQGFHVGGGLLLHLYRYAGVRFDVVAARSNGDQSGVIQEPVDLNRLYASGTLQLHYPVSDGLRPYLFGGAGVVNLKRDAPSYKFDLTEGAGVIGAGVQFRVANRVGAFAQVADWIYARTSVGGTQNDVVFSVGAAFRLVGNH